MRYKKEDENLVCEFVSKVFFKSKDGIMDIEDFRGGYVRDCCLRVIAVGLLSRFKFLFGWNFWKYIEVNNFEWGEIVRNIIGFFSFWFIRLFFG